MGYIICEKCGGYYELQPGEHPEDFDRCDCGGKLKYERSLIDENYDIPSSRSGFKLPSSKNLKTFGIGVIAILVLLVKFLPKSLILFWALLRFQNFDQVGPYYLIPVIFVIIIIATRILRPLLR